MADPIVAPVEPAPSVAPVEPAPTVAPTVAPVEPAPSDWKTNGIDDAGRLLIADRGWGSAGELLESYRNLEKLSGVPADQIIKIPKGSDSAEWNAVYDKMGRPAEASGYNLPIPEGDDGKFAEQAGKWMHEAGISQAAGIKLAEQWNAFQASELKLGNETTEAQVASAVGELKTAWGDDYQANSDLVDRAAQEFNMSDDQLGALKAAMGTKAAMEFMYNIGSKIGTEDPGFVRSQNGVTGFQGVSPEQARGEIERLTQDTQFSAMFVSADPKVRSDARAKMENLNKIAYPAS